ncbi:hypothetical protein HK097_002544, partial [Rhizophlyctis rosea]
MSFPIQPSSASSAGPSTGPPRQPNSDALAIDSGLIPRLAMEDVDELRDLSNTLGDSRILLGATDQTTMESNIMAQVDQALKERDDAADRKRLAKVRSVKNNAKHKLEDLDTKLDNSHTTTSERQRIVTRIETLEKQIQFLTIQEKEIVARMRERERLSDGGQESGALGRVETEKERLIRTGKITPFASARVKKETRDQPRSEPVPMDTDESAEEVEEALVKREVPLDMEEAAAAESTSGPSRKRRRVDHDDGEYREDGEVTGDEEDEFEDDDVASDERTGGDQDGVANEDEHGRKKGKYKDVHVDDGDEIVYQKRLVKWARRRRLRRLIHMNVDTKDIKEEDLTKDPELEMLEPSPHEDDGVYNDGYRIPGDIYSNLFDYQKTCTRWLWELHSQETGGIIGDEMGLGKTIQIISFLAGLGASNLLTGPVLIVCPATVLKQWVQEFHKWWPPYRVAILHSTGSGLGSGAPDVEVRKKKKKDDDDEDGDEKMEEEEVVESDEEESEDEDDGYEDRRGRGRKGKRVNKKRRVGEKSSKMNKKAKALVDKIVERGHVLVTTFAGLRVHRSKLIPIKWSYAVLDEGHKIRNPDAEITLAAKQLKTSHRIILSGTPIQNNLTELWSLFDFVFPGRLGTLPVFQSQFSIPISLGGYTNATNVQVQTAYKCACVLRDLISPYLLRRLKVDVAADLPKKNEQVLFCRLTGVQRELYKKFLKGGEVKSILEGTRHALYGIDILRKICNHPDLLERKVHQFEEKYGDPSHSGKMKVVQALLEMWHRQGHKALVFCQTRQMQDILEKFVQSEGYRYRRMDGATPIRNRIAMVDEFNAKEDLFVFLLTTKVGGLGINLTGANRIIIFDPDWNPSTDVQARERAWRVGQTKDVTIYRLMTSGTIEEKIYHRQIFKQFLTNKILKDPRQRRFFKSNDLHALFTLGSDDEGGGNETADMFQEANVGETNGEEGKEDVGRIQGVAKVDEYRAPLEEEGGLSSDDGGGASKLTEAKGKGNGKDGSATGTGEEDDSRILSALFSKTGVQSALHHDMIMDAASPEMILVQKEAERVANDAIQALKISRRQVRGAERS